MTARLSPLTRLAWLLPMSALVLGLFGSWGGAPVQASQTPAKPAVSTPGQQPPGGRAGMPPAQIGQPGPRDQRSDFKWWHDDAIKKELALTDQQISRIDRIYDQRANEIDPFVQEMFKQRDVLEKMTRERLVDVPTYKLQASHVDTLFAEIHVSRTVMLYRMSLVLTSDQNKKLQEINDRNGRGRRGGGGPHH